ncbi:hypothetical protein C1645_826769 [Glomus cerebriforme]|uniref:Uncharacterized protein n=1 Tax=Glomus cerebriforme TaxID=658196 RepID=A0A397SR23_9GLOM|nr:hypothetical protein C1645_826769 [Glomus cerebriforme]
MSIMERQKSLERAALYDININDIEGNPTKTKLQEFIKKINDKEKQKVLKLSGDKHTLQKSLCDFFGIKPPKIEYLEVDPRQIFYSQCCIKPHFTSRKNGENAKLVEETIEELVSGEVSPENIKRIRVVTRNEKMHSLDNRRLYSFKKAIERGASFSTITVEKSPNVRELRWKMNHYRSNDWSVVTVKDDCKEV